MILINEKTKKSINIEKSSFISYAYDVRTRLEIDKYLSELRKEHRKSTHIAYAYRLGYRNIDENYSDDGEPSLTAGFPILELLKNNRITYTLIAVVRYYGGVKLGTGGLKRAYYNSAKLSIEDALMLKISCYNHIKISYDYTYHSSVENLLQNEIIFDYIFSQNVSLEVFYKSKSIISKLIELTNGSIKITEFKEKVIIKDLKEIINE